MKQLIVFSLFLSSLSAQGLEKYFSHQKNIFQQHTPVQIYYNTPNQKRVSYSQKEISKIWFNDNTPIKFYKKEPFSNIKKIDKEDDPRYIYPWRNPSIELTTPPVIVNKIKNRVNTIGVPSLGYSLDNGVKVFHLIAQPIEHIIVNENKSELAHLIPPKNETGLKKRHHRPIYKKIKCWGYNGTTPGPTIEVNEGDRVRIILKNELPEPTSIHWHGIELPNDQDGATPETAHPVMPGETFTYEFTLYQSGTLMYHSGFNPMKQDHMGLNGMFIVHPKKYKYKIDKQFAIMLQQWAILPGSPYLDLITMNFNWFTFNGFAAQNIPVMTVNQGERVRIRFANLIMDSHPIHLHGYIWNVVGTEGGPIQESAQVKGSTILVAAGTSRDVEFVAWNPGLWRIHCHKLHHIVNAHPDVPMGVMPHGGMFTYLNVIPTHPNEPWQHPKQSKLECAS